MTGFLLGISFFIHLITLLSIIVVWKRFQATDYQEVDKVKKEMEDILLAYTTEMKEENDAFLKDLQRLNQKSSKTVRTTTVQPIYEESNTEVTPSVEEDHMGMDEPVNGYAPPVDETKEDYGPSLLSQVLSLKEQGYSLEDIAKKVNKGKGEVELLIKFYQDGR